MVDFDAEFMKTRQALAEIEALLPVIRMLAANPAIVEKIAADAGHTGTDVAKLAADINVLMQRVAALEVKPA